MTHGADDDTTRRTGPEGPVVGRAVVGRPTPPQPPGAHAAAPEDRSAPQPPGAHAAAPEDRSAPQPSGAHAADLSGSDRPSRLAAIMAAGPLPRRTLAGRLRSRTGRWLIVIGGLVVLAGAGTTAMTLRSHHGPAGTAPPRLVVPVSQAPGRSPVPAGVPADPGPAVTLAATGDIIMGAAPGGLPPNEGRTFFAGVRDALRADLTMGNLEQPLTGDTGVSKCPPPAVPSPGATASPPPSPSPSPKPTRQTCFAFRSPPGYAALLRDAGYRVMNLANNHAYDFGAAGNRQTRAALEKAGLSHTGAPGEITVVDVKGVKVAVLGFAPYPWAQSLTDLAAAAVLVRRAHEQADLVIVQMHVGAEGADRTHVAPGTETYLGENRGDSIAFAHAVVDAGADLVVGHGPHVLRAMEFYQGHLIAYSMGNFAGYKALGYTGVTGLGGILKVTLHRDGSYGGGSLVPAKMIAPGLPGLDPAHGALALVRDLSDTDLPGSGARIGADGAITPRS